MLYDLNGKKITWIEQGERYTGAIHSGSVEESHGCIVVDAITMGYIEEMYYYHLYEYERAANASLTESQIYQVLAGFYALEQYSEILALHYFWVYIIDPPQASSPVN